MTTANEIDRQTLQTLAEFRYALRQFMHFSEQACAQVGLQPQQQQMMLQIAGAPDGVDTTIGYIAERDCLIVFDGCEHVVDRVARQAEILLARCRNLQILATSREPLRIPEERVHRIAPLESPSDIANVTAAEALHFPAIQLFADCLLRNRDVVRFVHSADSPGSPNIRPDKDEEAKGQDLSYFASQFRRC